LGSYDHYPAAHVDRVNGAVIVVGAGCREDDWTISKRIGGGATLEYAGVADRVGSIDVRATDSECVVRALSDGVREPMERRFAPPFDAIARFDVHIAGCRWIGHLARGLSCCVVRERWGKWLRMVVLVVDMDYVCVDCSRSRVVGSGDVTPDGK
jgi:hypothetical protein